VKWKESIVTDLNGITTDTSNSAQFTMNRRLVGPRTNLDVFIGIRTMVPVSSSP